MTQVFCTWNGAHWVARVDGRTICGGGVEVRTMLYKLNYTPIFVENRSGLEIHAEK